MDGLQAERTTLAWRRTSLTIAVVALGMVRLSVESMGWVGAVGSVACFGAAVASYVYSVRRYRHAVLALASPSDRRTPGRACLLLSTASGGLAVVGLGWVITEVVAGAGR